MADPRVTNVFTDELRQLPAGAGFGGSYASVGEAAGREHLGATLYELEPGQTPFPFHYHRANEELLVVLRGRPTLRTPEGERELDEGEVVAFRCGPAGAHQLTNRSSETVRYLMFSQRRSPELVAYPDSDKIGAASFPQEGDEGEKRIRFLFRAADVVGYYEGEEAPS